MPQQISDELTEWTRIWFEEWVQNVYDDPDFEDAKAAREWLTQAERFAAELGLDFQKLVEEVTTEYERQRVKMMARL